MEGMRFWRRGTENSDKKERGKVSDTTARGVIGMMALIFIFQAVTFTIHKCSDDKDTGNNPVQTYSAQAPHEEDLSEKADSGSSGFYAEHKAKKAGKRKYSLFSFNPNTISIDSLQLLGLSYKQALAIIHYRDKGGRFKKKEDFSKMYTVSPQKYKELAPYITIPQAQEPKTETKAESKIPDTPLPKQEERVYGSSYESKSKVYIDLNEADSAALISVRGIGPYFCKAILSYRKALGSFASIDQLLEIKGMDQEKFDRIKDQVFVHPAGIRKFSIADSDKAFLSRHPYIGAYNARGIELFIQSQGKDQCTLKNLCQNNILSPEDTLRLHPYIK